MTLMSSAHFRIFALTGILLSYTVYLLTDGFDFGVNFNIFTFFDNVPSREQNDKILESYIQQGPRIIHEFCGSLGDCYKLVDKPYRDGGKVIMRRDLVPIKIPTAALSQAQLIIPKILNADNMDTSGWSIDKNIIISPYVMIMLATGYMIEALRFNRPQNTLLTFGLGGGIMQNYIHQLPKTGIEVTTIEIDEIMVDIAQTFFDNVQSDTSKIIIGDGIEYTKIYREKGELFDFVVLDACSNDKADIVICPIAGFRETSVVENIAKIIHSEGGIVVNIVAYQNTEDNEEKLLRLFAKHFKSCFLLRYLPTQRMLVCSHRSSWTFEKQRKRFIKNLREQQTKIGIQVTDPLLNFNPDLEL